MQRDLNDILPPSRRRALEAQQGVTAPPPAPAPAPAAPSMDMRPPAPERRRPEPVVSSEPIVAVPPVPPPSRRTRSRFPIGTALIALLVIAICGGVLYAFAGAKVTVSPVTNSATIASDMSATLGAGDLPFQIVTVEKTATTNVPAESTVTAADPASGTIAITNRQTTAQALIKNTRFQTPDGLIFRIRDSISIPAGGTITVTVYADEAGEKYNVGPTTFTVPGLNGTSAFDQVTAKSNAAMTGGFAGTRPSVAQATKDKQYGTMQGTLTTDLGKELASKIPEGYVLVPGASFTTFTPQTDAAGASGTVTLSQKGMITAVVFPSEALARSIAFKAVGTYNGQPVTLKSAEGLVVKPAEATIAPDATTFNFNLSGTTDVVWTVEASKIAGAVAGKSRDAAETALKSFPEVDKATLVLRPFWSTKFPADPEKIKVTVAGMPAGK